MRSRKPRSAHCMHFPEDRRGTAGIPGMSCPASRGAASMFDRRRMRAHA